jgi:hypothetical protein
VRGLAIGEKRAGPLEHHIVTWPAKVPRTRRPEPAPLARKSPAHKEMEPKR